MPVLRNDARHADPGDLTLGGVSLEALVRNPDIGTPTYVYDLDGMAASARALEAAFEGAPHLVCYAVKANSAAAVVRTLAGEGCGADVVSGAELLLALRCGVAPARIVFSGVAKTDAEIDRAIASGIGALQIESVEEIARISARAMAARSQVRVSLRINPGVDAEELDTHSYIATGHDEAKFGVALGSVSQALSEIGARPNLELVGFTSHVGSQFTTTDAYLASARAVMTLTRELRADYRLAFVDTGGGFGIDYGEGCAVTPADFIRETRKLQREMGLEGLALYCEPGRSLVGAHGVLVASVLQRKEAGARRWTMIDAGMNDLMRPALYQARHRILALDGLESPMASGRVVGPVCESSDDFGVHEIPARATRVVLLDAGAYGFSMASRYNGRPLPTEVFLRGGDIVGVHHRKATEDWVEDRLAAGAAR